MSIILAAIAIAAITYELSYSTLRKYLWLDQEYPLLQAACSPKFYRKILSSFYFTVTLPLIMIVLVVAHLHRLLFTIVNCKYCFAFWLSVLASIVLFHYTLPIAIVTGGLAVFAQTVNNFIKNL